MKCTGREPGHSKIDLATLLLIIIVVHLVQSLPEICKHPSQPRSRTFCQLLFFSI